MRSDTAGEDPIFARQVLVEGRVQGVGFRWHTRLEARALRVGGWVRNLDDGRVEAHVEGQRSAVEELIEWMSMGPSGAGVESVTAEDAVATGTRGFEIR